MSPTTTALIDTLAATAWDLRASLESQLRSLTSLQRCIEEYRRDRDPDALTEMGKHLRGLETNAESIRETLPVAKDALASLTLAEPSRRPGTGL